MSGLRIRTMLPHEVELAVAWAAAEGWNPGLADAGAFRAADPLGFLIAQAEGEPAGCISAVRYGDAFAFVGFYIVRPELRGRGIGRELWVAAMKLAGERNVGLDGVLAQVPNYERSGFALDHRNVRFGGRAGGDAAGGTLAYDASMFDAVEAYDREHFPAARSDFLRAWLAMPGACVRCAFDANALRGYGVVRPCRTGWKIGPLFADDAAVARRIFGDLRAAAKEGELFLDVPEVHAAGMALARDAGMEPVFHTARMYTRGRPRFALERCFGVTSFELG